MRFDRDVTWPQAHPLVMATEQLEEASGRNELTEAEGPGLSTIVKAIAALVGLGLLVYLVLKITGD